MNRSESTIQGIADAKAQGTVWGRYGAVLAHRNRQDAKAFAESLRPLLLDLAKERPIGGPSLGPRPLARTLNEMGVSARNGGRWYPATVHRLLKRLGPSFKQECMQMRTAKLRKWGWVRSQNERPDG